MGNKIFFIYPGPQRDDSQARKYEKCGAWSIEQQSGRVDKLSGDAVNGAPYFNWKGGACLWRFFSRKTICGISARRVRLFDRVASR